MSDLQAALADQSTNPEWRVDADTGIEFCVIGTARATVRPVPREQYPVTGGTWSYTVDVGGEMVHFSAGHRGAANAKREALPHLREWAGTK